MNVRILLQMDELVKGMRQAESITRQSAAGMQSALDGSTASMQQLEQAAQQTRSAAGWLGGALSGLAAVGMVTMKGIADTAMRTQELGIVLDVVSRNAGVATETTAKLEAEMKDLGMTTQAARTIITRMIQTDVDLSKATDLVRVAQDMAVISMEDSSTAAAGLMRAVVTMNPILLRKYGIMTGLEDIDRRAGEALGILSYETDKSGKKVKKWTREITAAERQQAIFNMILEEGAKFSGTYTEAMDAPGKAMRSFSRYIMEAQEAIGEYWLPILNQAIGMAGKLVKAFNNASPALKKFVAIALPVGTALASLAGSALVLYSQWGRILPVIKGVTALLSGLAAPVAAVIAVVAALGAAWHFNWFGIQEKATSAIKRIKELLGTLSEVIRAFISGAPGDYPWEDIFPPWLADITYEISHIFEGIRTVIQDMREGVFGVDYPWEDVFPPWLADAAYKIVDVTRKVIDVLQNLGQYFISVVQKGEYLNIWLFELPESIQPIIQGVGHFITILQDLVKYFASVIQKGEELNIWLFELPKPIQPIIKSLGKFVTILQDLIKYFVSVIQKGDILTVRFFELPKPIQSIIKSIQEFIAALWDLSKDFISIFQGILAVVQDMRKGVFGIDYPWEDVFPDWLADVIYKIIDAAKKVGEVLGALADTVLPPLQAAFESIRDTISKELGPTLDNLRELWEALGPVVEGLAKILGATIVIAIGVLGGLVAGLAKGFAAAFDNILRVVQGVIKVITGVLEAFGGVLKWLTGFVTGNLEDQGAGWQMMKDGCEKIVEGLKMAVINAFRGMIDFVTGLVSGFIDGVIGFFQNLYDRLVGGSIIRELFDSIREIITITLARAVEIVSTAVGNMIAAFANRISDFVTVGKDIILGVVEGIKAKAKALIDSVKSAVRAALDWIAEKLETGSYSKLFFEIGSDMMSGWTRGIQASQQGVIDSLAGMMTMPMTFAPQLAGAGGGETHYHYEYNEAEGIGADARASLRQQYEAMELYERLRS